MKSFIPMAKNKFFDKIGQNDALPALSFLERALRRSIKKISVVPAFFTIRVVCIESAELPSIIVKDRFHKYACILQFMTDHLKVKKICENKRVRAMNS